jgi:NADH-quinone oxidoreductase subunit K
MQILVVSFSLLIVGLITIVWNRDNIIKVFIGAELSLFAASWNFMFGFWQWHLIDSLVFILFILAIAAAEAAVGLGLAVLVFMKYGTIQLDSIQTMGG